MTNPITLDITTARSTLSDLIEKIYLKGGEVIITKRNIPLAKITPLKEKEEERVIDLSLFGLWKNEVKDSLIIEKELRTQAWQRNL